MKNVTGRAKQFPAFGIVISAATGMAVLLGGLWFASPAANATPAYASQTGLACGRCHVSPAGGGPRTAFGKAFAANGHKIPTAKDKPKSGAKPQSAAKPSQAVPAAVTIETAAAPSCGYYSTICNPRYGAVPEFGYSDALMFRLYPMGN
jgi:hypothetical protein